MVVDASLKILIFLKGHFAIYKKVVQHLAGKAM